MYSELYLRLEPLGLELIAQACRQAGHDVRIIDLQVFKPGDYFRQVDEWRPQAVGYSLNYLANIPQVVDLARETRQKLPDSLLLAGGHSASFVAREILDHAQGAIDCVVRGEGEEVVPRACWQRGKTTALRLETLPGVVLRERAIRIGLIKDLDDLLPPRDLIAKRKAILLVPRSCASVEFSLLAAVGLHVLQLLDVLRRSYRKKSARAALADDLARVREPGVFIVDDVAFIHAEHGHAIADEPLPRHPQAVLPGNPRRRAAAQ